MHGVYRGYDRLRLYERFGTLKSLPVCRDNGLFRAGLTELEAGLLEGANGRKTIAQLAQERGTDPLFALSFYYVFSLLSEVHLEARSPLGELYERALNNDYLQLLGVSAEASVDEVAEAWRRLRAQVAEVGAEASEEGREVIEVLKDAHLVLTHPHLRARYLEGLTRPFAGARVGERRRSEESLTLPHIIKRCSERGLSGAPKGACFGLWRLSVN